MAIAFNEEHGREERRGRKRRFCPHSERIQQKRKKREKRERKVLPEPNTLFVFHRSPQAQAAPAHLMAVSLRGRRIFKAEMHVHSCLVDHS